ncbi:MAG: methionine adenosyltransferase, partial [Anaerolineae bacterium]
LALSAAQEIVEQVEDIHEASVYILSQIGAPLEEPLVATALVRATNGTLTPGVRADVESVLEEKLARVHDLREAIVCRRLTLF